MVMKFNVLKKEKKSFNILKWDFMKTEEFMLVVSFIKLKIVSFKLKNFSIPSKISKIIFSMN